MAISIPWNEYEQAILLQTLIDVLEDKIERKQVISEVSGKLRKLAVDQGLIIDEKFRNKNGIRLQMSCLEYAYTDGKSGMQVKGGWYFDIVQKYRDNRDLFEKLLLEPFLFDNYANPSQPYSLSRSAKNALKEARATIAACIGALPEEIYFTSGGTESDNWAIKGFLCQGDNRIIITSKIEHHAVLNACAEIERYGFPVSYIPVNDQGVVISKELSRRLSGARVKLVSIILVNNEIGTIEPIADLARLAHDNGALFHTDAVQAAGHIPVDVDKLGVDMLSASAHKFNGPKGIGFLYVRNGTNIHQFHNGGAQEHGMRAGTENVASIVAMAVALQKNCAQMEENEAKLRKMETLFISALQTAQIDFIRNGAEQHVPGNINISIRGASGEMILHRMDLKGICISTGSACDSVNTQISHVIREIAVPKEYAKGTIRISFGRDNDEDDAVKVAEALISIFKK